MTHSPADPAGAIGQARQRLLNFLATYPDASWRSAPVDGDPRLAGVVVDQELQAALAAHGGD